MVFLVADSPASLKFQERNGIYRELNNELKIDEPIMRIVHWGVVRIKTAFDELPM